MNNVDPNNFRGLPPKFLRPITRGTRLPILTTLAKRCALCGTCGTFPARLYRQLNAFINGLCSERHAWNFGNNPFGVSKGPHDALLSVRWALWARPSSSGSQAVLLYSMPKPTPDIYREYNNSHKGMGQFPLAKNLKTTLSRAWLRSADCLALMPATGPSSSLVLSRSVFWPGTSKCQYQRRTHVARLIWDAPTHSNFVNVHHFLETTLIKIILASKQGDQLAT